MGLELQDVLNLWLVLRYQDGSTKIIQNGSKDLTAASLSLVERFKAIKTKFHFENDESASPVEIVYSSQSRQACEDFVNDTILASDDVYFQNRQNSVPDIRDVVTDCLNPLATSIKYLERDMQRLQGVVNALHEMNIEKFWSEPLHIDGDINVRPQLAENTREESENGQKSKKKKKKKKAKKVEELGESSRDTTPGPPSLSGPLNSEKNYDEEKIEYTLRKFGENLKPMGEIRKRSTFKHPDPLITAFCVFSEERGVKFQSVKKVPDEKNTFKATILTNKLPAYEVAFVKNEKCVEILWDTDSETFDAFKDILFCTAVVSSYPPDYFDHAEVFVMTENGLVATKEKPKRGVRYVVRC